MLWKGEKILTRDESRTQVVADVVGGLKGEQGGLQALANNGRRGDRMSDI